MTLMELNFWTLSSQPVMILLIGVVVTVYYLLRSFQPKNSTVLLDDQSLVEPGPHRIHASKLYKNVNNEVLHYLKEDIRTLYDTFNQGARLSNNGNCLGWRDGPNRLYVWQSYNETIRRAKNIGSGLIALGLNSGQNSILGINLQNCPEWIMVELAAYTYSVIVMPLYDTMGSEARKFIMEQSKVSVVVCEDETKLGSFLNQQSPFLSKVITLNEVLTATKERAKSSGVEIFTLKEVENLGAANSRLCIPPKPDDLCTICYTSGTTGIPKGVMLTHANVVAAADAAGLQIAGNWFNKDDVMLSFLPLAHMLERFIEHMLFKEGGAVGFFSGNMLQLNDDIATLKPTVMIAVPRVLNRIYDNIKNKVSQSLIQNLLFKFALSAKEFEVKRGVIRNNSIWDKLFMSRIQKIMGGRLRMIVTSSAPLSENVITFLRSVFGCQVIEGYGQTECLVVSTTLYTECMTGHVGPPVPCCKVKLIDVPEMEYYAANDQGEICVKGANVFKGYYKEPEKTEEVLDTDGWLHTGDIGEWTSNGALKIIDRKKHIFKLSQGEYIVPEKIENAYLRSSYVDQVLVHGESLKSCIIAIVVPNREAIINWALNEDIGGPFGSLCEDKRVKTAVLDDMLMKGNIAGLKSFEQVKDIYLYTEPFSVQNELLTPTLKSKRREIIKHFRENIDTMYKKMV